MHFSSSAARYLIMIDSSRNNFMEETIRESHSVIVVSNLEDLALFSSLVEGQEYLVFDVEGIRLSRTGQPTVATIGILSEDHVHVFIFDLIEIEINFFGEQMRVLKQILEDVAVTKIIHDCRQDSDALNEFFNIRLVGVFDTVIYYQNVCGFRQRLNNCLANYGIETNENRNLPENFYDMNPDYWARRPLTDTHIAHASGDVAPLFKLRVKLLAECSPSALILMKEASEVAVNEFRSRRFLKDVPVAKEKRGKVIGFRRQALEKIERGTETIINPHGDGFRILGSNQESVNRAREVMISRAK